MPTPDTGDAQSATTNDHSDPKDGPENHETDRDDLSTADGTPATLEERIASLEAELDGLRARVDQVSRADEAVEQRANAALAAVDRIEDRLDSVETARTGGHPEPRRGDNTDEESPARAPEQPRSSGGQKHPCDKQRDGSDGTHDNSRHTPDSDNPPQDSDHGTQSAATTGAVSSTARQADPRQSGRQESYHSTPPRKRGERSPQQGREQFAEQPANGAELAPNAHEGPETTPEERGIVDRLRDRL